jgi:RNA polymerase-binding transcription factor DksA
MHRKQLHKLLIDQQDELNNRLTKIVNDLQNRDVTKARDQQNIDRANDDVLTALKNEAEEKFSLTKKALTRLEKDKFGHCLICNNIINDERLTALPHTIYCRLCAQNKENDTISYKVSLA